jgi:hypothetical protein
VITEALELESENFLNGTLDDSLTHIDSQRFDRIEIEVKPWAFLSVSASANDFSPSVRHVSEFGQFVRLTFGERHDVFVLELAKSGKWEIQLDMIPTPSSSAKCDLHPTSVGEERAYCIDRPLSLIVTSARRPVPHFCRLSALKKILLFDCLDPVARYCGSLKNARVVASQGP